MRVICLGTYDPIRETSKVHESLGSLYKIEYLPKIKNAHQGVIDYLAFCIDQTYSMTSSLLDVNAMDAIDLVRCFDADVDDVCKLSVWSMRKSR